MCRYGTMVINLQGAVIAMLVFVCMSDCLSVCTCRCLCICLSAALFVCHSITSLNLGKLSVDFDATNLNVSRQCSDLTYGVSLVTHFILISDIQNCIFII